MSLECFLYNIDHSHLIQQCRDSYIVEVADSVWHKTSVEL